MVTARVSIAALLLCIPFTAGAQECTKLVFDTFCLGADIQTVTTAGPPELETGGGTVHLLRYNDDAGPTSVALYEGKIVHVSRSYGPSGARNYALMRGALEDRYGDGTADSGVTGTEWNAIAEEVWSQGEWSVRLTLLPNQIVVLGYSHTALENAARSEGQVPF
jgi:hypothetical protein